MCPENGDWRAGVASPLLVSERIFSLPLRDVAGEWMGRRVEQK